jgi:MFS superfamily sulfate permease-like transporter
VALIGVLPVGLPAFTLPRVGLDDAPLLIGGAVAIAIVALADTISVSTAFAARTGQDVKPNQEMIGIGTANIAAGFFQGFAVSTSGCATPSPSGPAKSQPTGLVGAAVIAVMLVFRPGLPGTPADPAAVVIVASPAGRYRGLRRLGQRRTSSGWRPRLRVALFGDLIGIAVAVVLSTVVFQHAWNPYLRSGRRPVTLGYHDVTMYPNAEQVPGLVIYGSTGR